MSVSSLFFKIFFQRNSIIIEGEVAHNENFPTMFSTQMFMNCISNYYDFKVFYHQILSKQRTLTLSQI